MPPILSDQEKYLVFIKTPITPETLPMKPKVAVIIPTKNEEKNISSLLKNLHRQFYKNIEIIVVDNYSTDKTRLLAKKLGAKAYLHGQERSNQRNFGAKKTKSKILFFVDADMTLQPRVIYEAVKLFIAKPQVKAIIVPEKVIGPGFWPKVRQLEYDCYFNEPLIEAPRIIRQSVFSKLSGYNKKLIAGEDWELTARIKEQGQISRITSFIYHHDKQGLIYQLKKKNYYAKNIKHYQKQYPKIFKAQAGIPRIRIFWKNRQRLLADPLHCLGLIILKFLEYIIYLVANIHNYF